MPEDTIETGVEAIEPNAANPLAEQVYQRLKTDIFNFRLFPGDRFSENGIAQLLRRIAHADARRLVPAATRRLSGGWFPARMEGGAD